MRAVRLLAVADSDSYLKWAAWTASRLTDDGGTPAVQAELAVVRSPLAPTPSQAAAAVAGTGLVPPHVLSPSAIARQVASQRPDVVLLAATGPAAELVALRILRASRGHRPALLTGLPGMGLPATARGTGWRRWADAFVVHARQEVVPYAEEFARHDVRPLLPRTRLPFLDADLANASASDPAAGRFPGIPHRVVFAAQAKVPAERTDRVRLVDGLARLADDGLDVVVKLRAHAGQRQTHNEPFPLDDLWAQEHARLGHSADALSFAVGPMADHLTPGTALLTVSSTAGLEALSRGLPTGFLSDFGVGPSQLNEPFASSGCLLAMDDVAATLRTGGPVPDRHWCEDGYLHAADELGTTVRDLALAARGRELPPRTTRPWSRRRHLRASMRSALPVAVSARLAH